MTRRLLTMCMVAGVLGLPLGTRSFLKAQVATPDPFLDVVRNLRHPKPETRLDALARLNEAAYVSAADAVAPLVTDPDDRVQTAAIDTEITFFVIDRIKPLKVMSFGGTKSRAQAAFDAGPLLRGAGAAPPLLLERLVAAMRDENPRVRFDAVHALGFIAERPLPSSTAAALVAEMDHYDPIMRAATARVLGRLRVREGADKLVQATVDSNNLVRQFAVEALGLVGEPRVAPQLRQIVAQPKNPFFADALLSLARLGLADDSTSFRPRLADRRPETRLAAVEGVGRLGDKEAIEALQKISQTDRSTWVRLASLFALQKLGQTQTHLIASRLGVEEERDLAQFYLFEIGRDAVPGIVEALRVAKDGRHRADLVAAIGYLGTASDVPTIEPLTKDRDDRVVRAATHALVRLRR